MKAMMRLVILTLFFGMGVAHAADDELNVAKAQLAREVKLLSDIEKYVERIDLARLFVLKKSAQNVSDSIAQVGFSNMATMRKYQELIVAYRFSMAFFQQIESDDTKDDIAELLRINDAISTARGFDDSPYTQITASVFTQMHKLVLQLTDGGPALPEELKQKLSELKAPLGNLIAIAKEGDRPKTFEAAVPVYHKIEALYPEFNQVMSSHAAFNLVLEIQGLNEFYAEFAQIH